MIDEEEEVSPLKESLAQALKDIGRANNDPSNYTTGYFILATIEAQDQNRFGVFRASNGIDLAQLIGYARALTVSLENELEAQLKTEEKRASEIFTLSDIRLVPDNQKNKKKMN